MVENLLNIGEEDLEGASNAEVIDMLLQMQQWRFSNDGVVVDKLFQTFL
jgi:hypothetical protein